MSYETNGIPTLRTIKATSQEPLTIDLGKTFVGTMTAKMRRTPNGDEYRQFTIVDNRYLTLTSEQTSDYPLSGVVTNPIEGKWYFDVSLDTGVPEELTTVYKGVIFFRTSIARGTGTVIPPAT